MVKRDDVTSLTANRRYVAKRDDVTSFTANRHYVVKRDDVTSFTAHGRCVAKRDDVTWKQRLVSWHFIDRDEPMPVVVI